MNTISNKRNYLFTLGSNFMQNAIAIILGLISVPISLNYWKVERYGVWALITSLLIYLSMTNLGLNTAATVLVSKNPDIRNKFKIVRRAFKMMVYTVAFGIICFTLINLFDKGWVSVLGKIPEYLKRQTFYACVILGFVYIINIPFSLISSLFIGFQKAYIDNLFNALINVGNFCSLILVILCKGNLVLFAFFFSLSALIINISKFLYFYFAIYKKLDLAGIGPSEPQEKEDTMAGHIFGTGMRFFFMGLASMIVWNTDNFVISNFLGITSVTPYSITFKLYNILFMLLFMINYSMMPLLAKEFGLNNWEWINKIYINLQVLASIIGGLAWLGGLMFLKDIVTLWAGEKSYAGLLCAFSLGGYAYLASMVNLNSNIITAFNYTRRVAFVAWMEALIKIGLSITFLHLWGMGGVALGTFLGCFFAPTIILPRWIVKRSDNRINYDAKFILKHFSFILLPLLIFGVLTQLFVSNILLRLFIGFAEISVYVFFSYLLMPDKVKLFLWRNFGQMLAKMGIKSGYVGTDTFTPNEIKVV